MTRRPVRHNHAVAGCLGGYVVGLPTTAGLLNGTNGFEPAHLCLLCLTALLLPAGFLPGAWLSDRWCDRHAIDDPAAQRAAFAAGGVGGVTALALFAVLGLALITVAGLLSGGISIGG